MTSAPPTLRKVLTVSQAVGLALDELSSRRIFGGATIEAVGNGHALCEHLQQRYGSSMVDGINPNGRWYSENAPPLLSFFEDGMMRIPRDRDISADLRMFTKENGIPRISDKRRIGERGEKRHGDTGVAILLAVVASREGKRVNNSPVETGATHLESGGLPPRRVAGMAPDIPRPPIGAGRGRWDR